MRRLLVASALLLFISACVGRCRSDEEIVARTKEFGRVLREILETVEEMGQGQQQEISMDGIKAIATKGTALAEITPAIAKFLYELRAAGNPISDEDALRVIQQANIGEFHMLRRKAADLLEEWRSAPFPQWEEFRKVHHAIDAFSVHLVRFTDVRIVREARNEAYRQLAAVCVDQNQSPGELFNWLDNEVCLNCPLGERPRQRPKPVIQSQAPSNGISSGSVATASAVAATSSSSSPSRTVTVGSWRPVQEGCFLRDVQALNDRKRGPQYAAVLMVVLDTLSLAFQRTICTEQLSNFKVLTNERQIVVQQYFMERVHKIMHHVVDWVDIELALNWPRPIWSSAVAKVGSLVEAYNGGRYDPTLLPALAMAIAATANDRSSERLVNRVIIWEVELESEQKDDGEDESQSLPVQTARSGYSIVSNYAPVYGDFGAFTPLQGNFRVDETTLFQFVISRTLQNDPSMRQRAEEARNWFAANKEHIRLLLEQTHDLAFYGTSASASSQDDEDSRQQQQQQTTMSRDDNYRKAMTKQLELIDQFHGLLPVGRDSLFQTVVLVFKGGSLLDPHLHLQTEDYFHNDGGGGEGEEVGLQTMFRIDAHFSDPRRSQLPKFQDDVRLILLMLL